MNKYLLLYIFVFVFTLLSTTFLESKLLPRLSKYAKQPIYADGPSWHQTKQGTPTMGGLGFLISISLSLVIASLFLARADNTQQLHSLLLICGYSILNAFVGIIDDITKLKRKENAGLSPSQKIAFQLVIAIAFIVVRNLLFGVDTSVSLGDFNLELGILYYPLCIIQLLGTVNCANLTDGIDGLASSVAFTIGISLLFLSIYSFNDVALVAIALIAGMLAFLFFNINPAKIFMGDTGSLFLGAIIASSLYSVGNPFLIIPLGGVYIIEGLSVILQVVYFKLTKRRIFKMAPLHHHLEKCGYSETKICMIAMLFTLLLSATALFLI